MTDDTTEPEETTEPTDSADSTAQPDPDVAGESPGSAGSAGAEAPTEPEAAGREAADREVTDREKTDREVTDRDGDADAAGGGGTARSNVRRYLNYALLSALVLLALVAGLRFYGAASSTINQWVAAEYRSLFHAAFNLALLFVAAAGISLQVKRLR
ncbi:hypothetical protein [Halobaculum sp. D14]|uniref:hypothetical protein n=1 Tax=Halobaculum sp. D14 TaxID=3421642 RepID=UPI003EBB41AA